MFLWFVGTALISMWFTFRDPAIDHRLVVLGALMPDGLDMLLGTTNFMHTLAAPILLLLVLTICTLWWRIYINTLYPWWRSKYVRRHHKRLIRRYICLWYR